jgi:hypothetical protein
MNKTRIISPMSSGNGAYIAHRLLEAYIPGYHVASYHPRWTYFPLMLPIVASTSGANLIHTTPDYSLFFHRKSAPMVITFQNYVLDRWMRDYSTRLQKIHYATDLRLWTKEALKKCSAVTAVSESTAQIVKQDMGLTEPIRVIYNGVDTNHFVPDLKKKFNSKEVRVLFSGNLTIRKGAHWLSLIAKKPIKFLWWNHFKFVFLHQGCFVHRRVFERIGGFRKEFKICMDYDFFYRALAEPLSVKFGSQPVALMGGAGVGSDLKFIHKRLAEERQVQAQNEQNPGWETAQFIFRLFYRPYKRFQIRQAIAVKSPSNELQ